MDKEHRNHSTDHIFFLESQTVIVKDFDATGFILDIGGGGEGVIGQLKEKQVIAIDRNRRELEEAPGGPLKIVMNAGELHFLDNAFDTATAFFTLMFIKEVEHQKVFDEVFRVLSPGGRFFVWDINLPKYTDQEKEIVAVYLNIRLPHKEIKTGYGAKWPSQNLDAPYYLRLAQRAGFQLVSQTKTDETFHLEFLRP